jgi:hypothetical protein
MWWQDKRSLPGLARSLGVSHWQTSLASATINQQNKPGRRLASCPADGPAKGFEILNNVP